MGVKKIGIKRVKRINRIKRVKRVKRVKTVKRVNTSSVIMPQRLLQGDVGGT